METIFGNTQKGIDQAAEILRRGGLVGFPTETVYGLGADASNPQAVCRVFQAKRRPRSHPLIVHLADASALDRWARDIPSVAWGLAERFWPGPLTLILRRAPGVLDEVTGGHDTIGLRIPGHPVALALLRAFGGGVAAPSANGFGRLSPTAAEHVAAELGGAVGCVLDGGACAVGIESTILDLSAESPRILRPGEIKPADLAETLGERPGGRTSDAPPAPGGMPAHYAPATPLRLLESSTLQSAVESSLAAGITVSVLSLAPPPATGNRCRWWCLPGEPKQYARVLYERLRQADAAGSQLILIEQPPVAEDWEAIQDRLQRASVASKEEKGERA